MVLLARKIELHVRCVFLKTLEQTLVGCSQNVVDFVNLIKFVCTREEREERKDLEEHAANTPYVHFITVVTIGQQALGSSVPPGRNVLGKRRLGVDPPAGAKIR